MIGLLHSSFKIAINSLWVSKARSLLTILGVVIGVASVIILVSVGSGLRGLVAGQFASLGSNLLMVVPGRVSGGNITSFSAFTNSGRFRDEDLNQIASLDGILGVTADLDEFVPVHYRGESMTALVGGASPDYFKIFNWSVAEGRFFNKGEFESGKRVVIIGDKVRRDLFKINPLGQDLIVGQKRYKVVGVLESKGGFGQFDWDATVYMPLSTAKSFFGRDRLDSLYLKVEEGYSRNDISMRIESIIAKRLDRDNFSIVEQGDLFRAADSILGAVTLALGGIAAISLIVGGIGIMNIMLVSVTERTREIGLRKAVGASSKDILWQFLIEAVVISSVGGLIGVALGFFGSFGLGKFVTTTVPVWSVLLAFSFSAFVGVIFGIIPALRAADLDPIEALRYE